jgi:F-type H+-transporting ATPase subunit gamma
MPSLKDLRNRIGSVKATQKITKAMQMVAAAKLRRAQEAAEAARPYAERMDAVLANLAAGVAGRRARRAAGRHRQGQVHLLVVMTGRARPVRRLQLVHRPSWRATARPSCSARARRSRS